MGRKDGLGGSDTRGVRLTSGRVGQRSSGNALWGAECPFGSNTRWEGIVYVSRAPSLPRAEGFAGLKKRTWGATLRNPKTLPQ